MLEQIRLEPNLSFPSIFSSDAELEGCYRWFSNDRVDVQSILQPHFGQTKARVAGHDRVLVVHDTTDIETAKGVGCRAHISLVIDNLKSRMPIGVSSFVPVFRHPREKKKADAPNEAERWRDGIRNSRSVLGGVTATHLGDSEIDSYANFAVASDGDDFVFRLHIDRKVGIPEVEAQLKLSDAFLLVDSIAEREVALSTRNRGNKSQKDLKWHPLRNRRTAKLRFMARAVVLQRPPQLPDHLPRELSLNAVRVMEIDTPSGELPVEWLLLTSLPVETVEQVLEVVDTYRSRWVIEEFFKALKTGCSLEARLLESAHAILNATALFIPIALDLLSLRALVQSAPQTPAKNLISELRIRILKKFSSYKTPRAPTVTDILLAIARLGGHIKNNGDPGWLVLGRGYQKLLMYEETWLAVLEEQKM